MMAEGTGSDTEGAGAPTAPTTSTGHDSVNKFQNAISLWRSTQYLRTPCSIRFI